MMVVLFLLFGLCAVIVWSISNQARKRQASQRDHLVEAYRAGAEDALSASGEPELSVSTATSVSDIPDEHGQRPLRFMYQGLKGAAGPRRLEGWYEDPDHVVGFCTLSKAERTFRKDRVVRWLGGDDQLECRTGVNPPPRPRSDERTVKYWPLQGAKTACQALDGKAPGILFTGWAAHERDMLEQMAEGAGFKIKTNVSAAVTVLCAGPNAGHAKLEKAQEFAIPVISAEQLAQLISEGWD